MGKSVTKSKATIASIRSSMSVRPGRRSHRKAAPRGPGAIRRQCRGAGAGPCRPRAGTMIQELAGTVKSLARTVEALVDEQQLLRQELLSPSGGHAAGLCLPRVPWTRGLLASLGKPNAAHLLQLAFGAEATAALCSASRLHWLHLAACPQAAARREAPPGPRVVKQDMGADLQNLEAKVAERTATNDAKRQDDEAKRKRGEGEVTAKRQEDEDGTQREGEVAEMQARVQDKQRVEEETGQSLGKKPERGAEDEESGAESPKGVEEEGKQSLEKEAERRAEDEARRRLDEGTKREREEEERAEEVAGEKQLALPAGTGLAAAKAEVHGGEWVLVFRQHELAWNPATRSTMQGRLYDAMDKVQKYRNHRTGKFRFKMVFPHRPEPNWNIWSQKSNPASPSSKVVQGFVAEELHYSGDDADLDVFHGLKRSSHPDICLYHNHDPRHPSRYWYCLGYRPSSSFPGPDGDWFERSVLLYVQKPW